MVVKNYMIRDGLWNSQGLTSTEKMVALCLVQYRNEVTNECVPAQRLIARRTGFSLRAVAKALASLEKKMLVARWPGRNDFCQYDFWLPAFYVNSVHHVHTPPKKADVKFKADSDCIPAWEAEKRLIGNFPPDEAMSGEEFLELVRFCDQLPKPKPIKPWPLNLDAVRYPSRDDIGPDPEDLGKEQWATHNQRANELMGVV